MGAAARRPLGDVVKVRSGQGEPFPLSVLMSEVLCLWSSFFGGRGRVLECPVVKSRDDLGPEARPCVKMVTDVSIAQRVPRSPVPSEATVEATRARLSAASKVLSIELRCVSGAI